MKRSACPVDCKLKPRLPHTHGAVVPWNPPDFGIPKDVLEELRDELREHAVRPERLAQAVKMTNGFDGSMVPNELTDGCNTPADTLSGYDS